MRNTKGRLRMLAAAGLSAILSVSGGLGQMTAWAASKTISKVDIELNID